MDRRECCSLFAVSAFSLFLPGCMGQVKGPSLMATSDDRIKYATRLLKELCSDIGPHPCGSKSYDTAAGIVKRELERFLPDVEFDTLTFDEWTLLNEPRIVFDGKPVEAIPSHGSGGTPVGGINGIVTDCTMPNTPFAVVDKRNGEILARIAISEAWATGRAVSRPWYRYYEQPGGVPVINFDKNEVTFLKTCVAKKAEAELSINVKFNKNKTSSNVIGTFPGVSSEEIIVYAHLDTVYNSEGANDNTGSVILLLMLAHALSGKRHARTLRFIVTTGEEYGYLGTKHYAERRKREGNLNDIYCVINFDSVTWGLNPTLISMNEELVGEINDIHESLHLKGTPSWRKSDGLGRETQPLKDAGLDALGLVVDSLGYDHRDVWHRPEDTPTTVPLNCFENYYLLFSELLFRLSEKQI